MSININNEINVDEIKIVNITREIEERLILEKIIASLNISETCDTGSYIYYSTENTTYYDAFKWWASGPQPPQEESIWEGIW